MPFAGHVGKRRLPARAYPQVSWCNDSHRPIIHRLQPRPQRDTRCGTSVADHRRPPWLSATGRAGRSRETPPPGTGGLTPSWNHGWWMCRPGTCPARQRPIGAGSRAPQGLRNAVKRGSNGLRSPGCGRVPRAEGRTHQARVLPGQTARPMWERRPWLAYKNPAHFRHPPRLPRAIPRAKEAARWLQPYAPCGRQQPPQQQLPISPPRSRLPALSRINPLRFIYPPTSRWAGMRAHRFVRRVLPRAAAPWRAADTNLRAAVRAAGQERGPRQGTAAGRTR